MIAIASMLTMAVALSSSAYSGGIDDLQRGFGASLEVLTSGEFELSLLTSHGTCEMLRVPKLTFVRIGISLFVGGLCFWTAVSVICSHQPSSLIDSWSNDDALNPLPMMTPLLPSDFA